MTLSQASKDVLITWAKWIGFVMLPIGIGGWLLGEPIGNFIVENTIVYCTLLWIMLCLLWGMIEAHYFFYQNTSQSNDKYNPHYLFVLVRSIVLIFIWITVKDWKSVLCLIGMFSFFHDGMYYVQRNKIDGAYPKKWFDQSTTSSSWFDIKNLTNPIIRTAAAIISIAALIYINYVN